MRISAKMAKEFARDYLGTLRATGLKNTFRTAREIAMIMNISFDTAIKFIVVAERNGFIYEDNMPLTSYTRGLTLFKVWEENLNEVK